MREKKERVLEIATMLQAKPGLLIGWRDSAGLFDFDFVLGSLDDGKNKNFTFLPTPCRHH